MMLVRNITFFYVCRRTPFPNSPGDSASDILNRIGPGYVDVDSGIWTHISNEAKELVLRMLHIDPHRRPTAAGILKYSWIANRHRLPQKFLPETVADPLSLKVFYYFFFCFSIFNRNFT